MFLVFSWLCYREMFWALDRDWALSGIAALPEVHLLPHHRAPHAEEAPQVAQGSAVERILVYAAVFEVGDAVAGHELPGSGVQRH